VKLATYFLALGLLISPLLLPAQLVINEILAGNQNDIQDDFFDHDDWVEIYNGGSIVNLAGYYLSDDPDSLDKFLIPNTNGGLTTVLPDDHLIFWMDNDLDQGENHTNFRLSTDGEWVILTAPDGETIIDSINFPHQQRDISYGRSCDGCEDWIYFDITTPDAPNAYVQPETQLLYINEVLPVNVNGVQDQSGENEGWIEIFNPNPIQVNLANYSISINGGDPHVIPANDPPSTVAEEDNFRILFADDEVIEGADHLPFTLPVEGATITLFGPDDAIVDTYTYPGLSADVSYGRSPDGGLNSQQFTVPTPRMPNDLVIIVPELLYINEFMAENNSDTLDTAGELEDWIEIFNPNEYAVDLAGYWFTDNPQNPMKWQVPLDHPDSSVIAPGGYLLFFADEQQSEGWNHMNFRLNNAGEWVELRSPDGFSLADGLEYEQQYGDTSFGRGYDGAPYWVYFTETTPEYSNNGAAVNIRETNEPKVSVYPNPLASGQAVRFSQVVNWRVFSTSGQLVTEGRGDRITETSAWRPGLYLIEVDNRYRLKVLVAN
jgi:hypothetical protein